MINNIVPHQTKIRIFSTKKFILIIYAVIILIAGYCILHITPQMAFRTHLFFNGHYKVAFTSKITHGDNQSSVFAFENDEPIAEMFYIDPPPIDKETGIPLDNWVLLKQAFFYKAISANEYLMKNL